MWKCGSRQRRRRPRHPTVPVLISQDRERDLAFFAVKSDLPPLPLADTFAFRKGEEVTAIGNPGGPDQILENAISRGVLSTKTVINGEEYYQLNIAVNPGNSGGPVLDPYGRVIGVVTLKSTDKEAVAYCIPVQASGPS